MELDWRRYWLTLIVGLFLGLPIVIGVLWSVDRAAIWIGQWAERW